jgi:hypothetical protein
MKSKGNFSVPYSNFMELGKLELAEKDFKKIIF